MPVSSVEHEIPILASAAGDTNSKSALAQRCRAGRVTWAGPLLVVAGRSILIIAAQAFFACLSFMRFHIWSWNGAAKWWTVYGTLVDAGCLTLMAAYTRKEGIRLRDLIGRVRLRWGRDIFVGAGCLLLIFPFFLLAFPAASWLVYGSIQPPTFSGTLSGRVLPSWGIVYSFCAWWLVWSPTEEMTYNGYALPRIEVLSRESLEGHRDRRLLLGDPAQLPTVYSGLAIRGLAVPGLSTRCLGIHVGLLASPATASSDSGALGYGHLRSIFYPAVLILLAGIPIMSSSLETPPTWRWRQESRPRLRPA